VHSHSAAEAVCDPEIIALLNTTSSN